MAGRVNAIFIALALAGASSYAGSQSQSPTPNVVRFTRHAEVGDQDLLKIEVQGSTDMGDFDFMQTQTRAIKKVYGNGDADVEISVTSQRVTLNGNNVPIELPQISQIKLNKQGLPTANSVTGRDRMNLAKYAAPLYNRDLKLGTTFHVEQTSADKNETIAGKVRFDSIQNGDAKFSADLENTQNNTLDVVKVHLDIYMNLAASKIDRIEETVAKLPISDTIKLENAKMVYERVSR